MKKAMLALSVIGLLSVNLMAVKELPVGDPTVGDSVSTALGAKSNLGGLHPNLFGLVKMPVTTSSLGGTIGTVSATPILGPAPSSVDYPAFAANVMNDAKNRNVRTQTNAITSPTDYTICHGKIDWWNTVYSSTSSYLWDDKLDPLAPFQNQKGHIISQLIQAESFGGDTISMSMLSVSSGSSDGNNVLGDQLLFVPADYSSLAIGIRSNGTMITSGPSTQKAARVIFLTTMKLFNGGGTQAGLNQVRDWVFNKGNFTIRYMVQIIDDPGSTTFASVSINGYSNARPTIGINRQTGVIFLTGSEDRYYLIMTTTDLSGSSWQSIGSIYGNGSMPIAFVGNRKFLRAVAQ